MAKKPVTPKQFFTKVVSARAALSEKAIQILDQYLAVIKKAEDAGDYEVATKSLQWLIEHMPEDTEGARMVGMSVDKEKQAEQQTGPRVQIGIQLGGVSPTKQLEAPTVTSEAVG